MLNINMLDFVLNYPSKKTKKKKKGLEHEVFLRAFIQNTSQICEWILYKMGSANRNETPSVMLKSMIEPLNYLRNKKERILEDIRTSFWSTAIQVNGKSDLRFDACEKAEMGWGF